MTNQNAYLARESNKMLVKAFAVYPKIKQYFESGNFEAAKKQQAKYDWFYSEAEHIQSLMT